MVNESSLKYEWEWPDTQQFGYFKRNPDRVLELYFMKKLTDNDLKLYLFLLYRSYNTLLAWPTRQEIIEATGLTEQNIRTSENHLIKHAVLTIVPQMDNHEYLACTYVLFPRNEFVTGADIREIRKDGIPLTGEARPHPIKPIGSGNYLKLVKEAGGGRPEGWDDDPY